MSCEALFPFESLIAMVELEGFLQSMLLHVLLQITRSSANMVALVTREWSRVTGYLLRHLQLLSPLHSVSLR